ncbi:MAG: tetratricopeptide repeat protein [Burkholderia sp.]|jgi:predicted O-linked N-acetylglucosamine transferase (SPINDLY family)|uniref:tetratricopeptide repeat protein n=3 Tax=Pseudomonadota TaxID=1224 RepID=UPI00158CBE8F|nr:MULTISPECIES: tetratricopeptide repeat protein [Burkholderia]MBY8604103.1 tetratricopeptide repeat protein [Burkholderia arboris]MCA3778484.1 tetratricopeptide repeat protein [Burkholderia sp.]MCA3783464.1 tetratricopeptide repeat protein [Burkholderia sp.]MCA3797104.1 tetratricopeptide repeat protein [Burkholderia sp.]MCA3800813.1 tetratricopeptide repeat protein [Burkholderia sp.]
MLSFDLSASATLTPEQQLAQDIALVLDNALERQRAGAFDDARALYEAILDAVPAHGDAHYNLAILLVDTGRPADAVPHFEAALGANPTNGYYWVSYIHALHRSGQAAAAWIAVEIAQQRGVHGPALDGLISQLAMPDTVLVTAAVPAAHPGGTAATIIAETVADAAAGDDAGKPARRASRNLLQKHAALYAKGKYAEATAHAQRLVAEYPDDGACWRALSASLHKGGRFAELIDAGLRTVALLPDEVLVRILLADTLRVMNRLAEADEQCQRLLQLQPDHPEAMRIRGLVLFALRRIDEAIAACRRAVELAPSVAAPYGTLGFVLLEQGATQEALGWLRRSIEIDPTDCVTHSSMLFCIAHSSDFDPQTLVAEHRKFGQRYDNRKRKRAAAVFANPRNPARKLRVGFVSGDLFGHAVASYALPVIEQLATDPGIAMHFYHNHVDEDSTSERFKSRATSWRNVAGMSDEAFLERMRNDGIDIAIDLSGHTGRNRLVALAQRAAPVQASWIGYPATTGVTAIDYYLTDRFVAPPGAFEDQFVEKMVRLPAIAPFMPPPNCPPVNVLPALHNGYTTYASFNRLNKLSPHVIEVWARVLHADPTARMALGAIGSDGDQQTLTEWFARAGIDANRLTFHRRSNIPVYMQQHHGVDLCLDAFPYTGSTTTLNALWMGVPTVTIPGATMAGRGSAGWLQHVGLDAYIATDEDDFVAKALALGHDTAALQALRTGLRARCAQSAAFRPDVVAAGLSSALRTMWTRWCANEPVTAFDTPLFDDTATAQAAAEA